MSNPWPIVSCELVFNKTTGPTGGSQNREYWGGPTYGQAKVRQPPVVIVLLLPPWTTVRLYHASRDLTAKEDVRLVEGALGVGVGN